jgi:hypothetical protein
MDSENDLINLPDGRQARLGADGRYHDVHTGRWLAASEVESLPAAGRDSKATPAAEAVALTQRQMIRDAICRAARRQGHDVDSAEQAVGKLIEVQAEIALDKDDPAKATAAARLLDKLTGLFAEAEEQEDSTQPWFVLGRELAIELLALVEEEQERRGVAQD